MGVNCAAVNVSELSRRSDWCSFRVPVPSSDVNNVLNAHWEDGVTVRPFRPASGHLYPANQHDQAEHPKRRYRHKPNYSWQQSRVRQNTRNWQSHTRRDSRNWHQSRFNQDTEHQRYTRSHAGASNNDQYQSWEDSERQQYYW